MRKFFQYVFFGFNALMVWWLLSYWSTINDSLHSGSKAHQTGAALGATVGTGMILVIWTLGAVITGLLAILTRGQRATKGVIPPPAKDSTPKKKCPMCAEMVQLDARICRFCGYNFELQDRLARLGPPAG
jgi:hypothetical protein